MKLGAPGSLLLCSWASRLNVCLRRARRSKEKAGGLCGSAAFLGYGMTSWMAGWKRKGWKTASGDPVKNKELWVQLDDAASDHEQVRWHWVKGHIGHPLNERADLLAVAATRHAARTVL